MLPKGIPKRLKGFRTGANGYSGISVTITTLTSAKTEITEIVEVNNPLMNPTLIITEEVLVTVT